MAKIKYIPEATPLLNEHDGYTFQPSNYGQSMFPASRSARKRYKNQFERMQNNQKAVRHWREMSPGTKQAWNDFAAAFPQPSKRDPNKFLSGYQCFIKRNSFCFLNHGINSDFMLEPELTFSDSEEITIELKSSSHVIECAELYIKNFGLLPQVGDKLLVYAAVYSEYSGHFYLPVSGSAIVEQVFADSFQASINVPDTFESVTISLYLSKPVSAGISYVGTKMRYMGCFTTKKFIELQDTPSSYLGEAGKIPAVNPEENGLIFIDPPSGGNAFNPIQVDGQPDVTADNPAEPVEFVAGDNITIETSNDPKQVIFSSSGGGGFNCDDLLECNIIQNIIQSITETNESTIPPSSYGLLYNGAAYTSGMLGRSGSGFDVPTRTQWQTIINAFGGVSNAGPHFKDTDPKWWLSMVGNEDNSAKFFGRPAGYISGSNGASGSFKQAAMYAIKDEPILHARLRYNADTFATNAWVSSAPYAGISVRLCNPNTTLPNGSISTYVGNDGKVYRTIVIAGIEITADNLFETKLSNGNLINYCNEPAQFVNQDIPSSGIPAWDSNNI